MDHQDHCEQLRVSDLQLTGLPSKKSEFLPAHPKDIDKVNSHVIKAEGKQRTRTGCNGSMEDQGEVEDKAEQAKWLQTRRLPVRKSEKVTRRAV